MKVGDPGRIRTCDLQIRNLPLYPAELRGHRMFEGAKHPSRYSIAARTGEGRGDAGHGKGDGLPRPPSARRELSENFTVFREIPGIGLKPSGFFTVDVFGGLRFSSKILIVNKTFKLALLLL